MKDKQELNVFWFRRDLRLQDNHGLYEALQSGPPVLPFFLFDTEILGHLEDSADARVTFIHKQLGRLREELRAAGSDLLVLHSSPQEAWRHLAETYSIRSVFCNHDYEPLTMQRDQNIAALLREKGIGFHSFKDIVVFEKDEVMKDDGQPYVVFTPYSRAWKRKLAENGIPSYPSDTLTANFVKVSGFAFPALSEIGFRPNEQEFAPISIPQKRISEYDKTRDFPSLEGTSRLGVHFRFGTLSIRDKVKKAMALNEKFLDELIWREFYHMILFNFPHVVASSFRVEYDAVPWRNNEEEFQRWCEGKTGYPLVDAGMRQLNETGWMHNRVRMVTASFLCKHLLIDWRWGEAYFASRLLDFELASNNGGWQWAAGCGVDAAPYFRVFNPTLQEEKFDKTGEYVRRFVPEIATDAYPKPMVEHSFARERCLAAYKQALKRN